MAPNHVSQVAQFVAEWYLSRWVNMGLPDHSEDRHLLTYGLLVAAFIILAFVRMVLFMKASIRASRTIHDEALSGVLAAPIRLFDSQPVGRIINRFSKDLSAVDDHLPGQLLDVIQGFCLVLGIVLLVSILNPWLFILFLPVATAFVYLRAVFVRTTREIKRMEAMARSPVYAHLSTTLAGLSVIRNHPGMQERFRFEYENHQDAHTRVFFVFVVVSRWLGARVDVLVFFFLSGTAFAAVAARDALTPGAVGLSLLYVLQMTGMNNLQFLLLARSSSCPPYFSHFTN